MTRIVGLSLVVLMFSGCVTPLSQEEISKLDYGAPSQNHEATIKKYFDQVLFDPYSAHYDFGLPRRSWYKEAPLQGSKLYAGYLVPVRVNAKNRFGAYVGKKMYGFILKDERIIKVLDDRELRSMKHFK
jgi:hypothetical protein